jgi:hypothetical protein
MVPWRSSKHLEDHFVLHGAEVEAATVEQYDASANATLLRADVVFEYDDPRTGEPRVGSFEVATGLFVAVDEDDEIVTHCRTDTDYIRFLLAWTD